MQFQTRKLVKLTHIFIIIIEADVYCRLPVANFIWITHKLGNHDDVKKNLQRFLPLFWMTQQNQQSISFYLIDRFKISGKIQMWKSRLVGIELDEYTYTKDDFSIPSGSKPIKWFFLCFEICFTFHKKYALISRVFIRNCQY